MRLESKESAFGRDINSESDFFGVLRSKTYGTIYMERIEPSNESGFPDVYFVSERKWEGTMELKHCKKAARPNLAGPMVRGTQKTALIEYYEAGGRRRWFACFVKPHYVWLYDSRRAMESILRRESEGPVVIDMSQRDFTSRLTEELRKDSA